MSYEPTLPNPIVSPSLPPNVYNHISGEDMMDFQTGDNASTYSNTNGYLTPTPSISSLDSTLSDNSIAEEPEEKETNRAKKRKIVLNCASGL
ncbi:hypothetical protein K7432_004104 [Basidiobolus ranarum]|uniref:Uncharacterized protein n=1 Tax=Basidiobolus ranarum TaxID=34480 RepID=A0ABR2W552_9FUNG